MTRSSRRNGKPTFRREIRSVADVDPAISSPNDAGVVVVIAIGVTPVPARAESVTRGDRKEPPAPEGATAKGEGAEGSAAKDARGDGRSAESTGDRKSAKTADRGRAETTADRAAEAAADPSSAETAADPGCAETAADPGSTKAAADGPASKTCADAAAVKAAALGERVIRQAGQEQQPCNSSEPNPFHASPPCPRRLHASPLAARQACARVAGVIGI